MTRLTRDYSTARQYLAKVLPWPQPDDPPAWIGISYKGLLSDGKNYFWQTRGVASVTEAISTVNWLSGLKNTRDIYVCMGSLRTVEEKTTKRGFKYLIADREQEQVVGLKSLYIDLDAKGTDRDSYASIEEAVTELFKFLKSVKFPAPSLMVKTGGGVHVYWTLDQILTPDEWLPLAHALVNAAKQHDLKFDAGCTTDYARILRIPCTFNHKFTPPKDVKLVDDVLDFDYAVSRIAHALEPYKVAVRSTSNGNYTEDPDLFKGNRSPLQDNDLSAGIEDFQLPKPPLVDLAHACPFVMEACRTGGADYLEPLWHNTMQLALWTQEGEAAAHVMSDQHPDYTWKNTNEKYETAVDAQIAKSLGWPQCKTIHGNGSKPCKTCPHLAAGKSPLNFITFKSNQFNGVPFQSSVAGMKTILTGDIDLPEGYIRDKAGYVSQKLLDDAGATFYVRVLDYVLVNPFLSEDPNKGEMLNFTTSTRVGVIKPVQISAGITAGQEMRKELQSIGLMMQTPEVKRIGEFFVAWTQKLQKIKEAAIGTDPFGWSREGFAYGGTLYTPTGSRNAPPSDHALATQYMPVGDLKVWYDAAKMITDQGRPALDAILAAAFAAPLVRATGQPGLLMSLYSIQSGIGKTTAMKVAQAVWGDPVRAMQGLNDTQNSVINKLGKLRSLPMYWDELKTEEDTRKMVLLYFTVTQGREKGRLRPNAEQREAGSWETLLVTASNESMIDYVVNQTKMTTAGIYRMFEFTVDPGQFGKIAVSDAARMISALNQNYGNAGQIYADFLGSNYARIDKEVADLMVEIGNQVNVAPDERFWSALVAIIILGATYANELGLTNVDLPKLRQFMLDQFYAMRQIRDDQPVDMAKSINVADMLVQFLRDMRARNTLVTDTMWRGRGKPKQGTVKVLNEAKDALIVHVATKDRRLLISLSGLQDWLEKRGAQRHVFVEALKAKFGATRVSATLGAGTSVNTGSGFALDIDMTQPTAKLYLQDLTP